MMSVLQPAAPEMAEEAATLIYLTMRKTADYLFGGDQAQVILKRLFQFKSNRFSYQFTQVTTDAEKPVGLVIAYPAQRMRALELPMAFQLMQICGMADFFRFLQKTVPLAGIKEAEDGEYFIGNIAVLPACQGAGLGTRMLEEIQNRAKAEGYDKISLTVDVENGRAASLYERTGFHIIEQVEVKSLRRRIGYAGFYRMVKEIPPSSHPAGSTSAN